MTDRRESGGRERSAGPFRAAYMAARGAGAASGRSRRVGDWRWAATVLLLVWRLADWSQIGPAVRVLFTRPELLVVSLAGYTLAFGLRAFAWRQLIVSGGGVFSLFAILQAALLANHLLPFKLGEVARPALATRRGSFHRRLPAPLQTRVAALRTHLTQMCSRRVVGSVLWTLPSWVLVAVVLMVAAQALGIDVSPTTAIVVTAFTILFQVFHVTPGGIGVYEASMTGALYALGVDWHEGLAVAVLTHGMKFAYSYSVALFFSLVPVRDSLPLGGLGTLRGAATGDRQASRFEILAARAWNVLN